MVKRGGMTDEALRDAVLVIAWLAGLHEQKSLYPDEEIPLALAAAHSFLRQYAPEKHDA